MRIERMLFPRDSERSHLLIDTLCQIGEFNRSLNAYPENSCRPWIWKETESLNCEGKARSPNTRKDLRQLVDGLRRLLANKFQCNVQGLGLYPARSRRC